MALLLAYIAAVFTALYFYRIESVYQPAVFLNKSLMAVSPCVGLLLLVREIRNGRRRNALWPAILVAVTGGALAVSLLGRILWPDPN